MTDVLFSPPDMTFAVDWALKANYLSIYLSVYCTFVCVCLAYLQISMTENVIDLKRLIFSFFSCGWSGVADELCLTFR